MATQFLEATLQFIPDGSEHGEYYDPYARIVGLEVSGVGKWDNAPARRRRSRYGIRERQMDLPAELAGSVLDFALQYIPGEGDRYNCHLFAATVCQNAFESPGTIAEAKEHAEQIMRRGQVVEGPLPFGTQGVLGAFAEDQSDLAYPLHSVVGLDPERDEWLQVDIREGSLCLSSYAITLAHYREFLGYPTTQLYAAKQQ